MILRKYYYVIVKRLTRGASSVKIPDIFSVSPYVLN